MLKAYAWTFFGMTLFVGLMNLIELGTGKSKRPGPLALGLLLDIALTIWGGFVLLS